MTPGEMTPEELIQTWYAATTNDSPGEALRQAFRDRGGSLCYDCGTIENENKED